MTQFDDEAFLADPMQWPRFPVCPVKRYAKKQQGEWPELGVVLAGKTCVAKIGMYDLTPEAYDAADKIEYESIGEMIADGWMVD